MRLYFTSRCFETCVNSFKNKLLTPIEKDCFKTCVNNLRGLYIEYDNGRKLFKQHLASTREDSISVANTNNTL